jgi:FtsP/CotA-like multicopper oxidase with cupredoxin domain
VRPLIVIFVLLLSHTVWAAERYYELSIDTLTVNISGKSAEAMVINQTIPGPKLTFDVGDTAVIKVNNFLSTDASVHWHGLLLPQAQDGVPYITYFPIKSGESFTYRFPITHAGTYWYHSHTNIDEQRGQYGPIVIHPKDKQQSSYDHDEVVQLSDWTDEDPLDVLKNLKKSGDWYAYQKQSVVSLKGYLERGLFDAWLTNRWQRMEGMDVSDVAYDAFLANGKTHLRLLPEAKAGDKVRLRLINSAASSYFTIEQSEAPFTVIAADGVDVQPVKVESLRMGMAETYDVVVEIPPRGGLDIHANNIDGTGYSRISIGSGNALVVPLPTKPDLYQAMNHSSHSMDKSAHSMDQSSHHMGPKEHNMDSMPHHSGHQDRIAQQLSYKLLKTTEPINYSGPLREIQLNLTGNMESYNWSFNDQILSEADKIQIGRGEVVRFVFNNTTMMRHPLHLHGHFFKVLSGNGDYDVLKHTVDVGPMEKVTIEFAANKEKDWFFHCHNLYHSKTGMARVVRYSDYNGNPAFDKAMRASNDIKDTDWYSRLDSKLYNDYAMANLRYNNYHYALELNVERSEWGETESNLLGLRRVNRWTQLYIAAEYENSENDWEYQLGIRYQAPFNIEVESWLNTDKEIHLGIETEFQLTTHWLLNVEADTEGEYSNFLEWRNSPNYSIGLGKTQDTSLMLGFSITL